MAGLLKIEGENRIDIESVADDLAAQYQVPDKQALRWLCVALQYSRVHEAIVEQIDYLLEQNVITK